MRISGMSLGALRASALCAACLAMCVPALGQDGVGHYGRAPVEFVSGMFRHYDVVADGEFYAFPEYSEAELRSLRREDVVIRFRVDKWYKWWPKEWSRESFEVRLPNDMLAFPGEDVSRFERRNRILDRLDEELESLLRQHDALAASCEAGEIGAQECRARAEEIELQLEKNGNRGELADGRIYLFMDHASTFYELGGAVRPGEKYVIACNDGPDGSRACALDPFFRSAKLYWGEKRAYTLPGFEALRFATPEELADSAPTAALTPPKQP